MRTFRPVLAAALLACAVPVTASAECVPPYACVEVSGSGTNRVVYVSTCVVEPCTHDEVDVGYTTYQLREGLKELGHYLRDRFEESCPVC